MAAAVLTGPAVVTGPSVTTGQGNDPIARVQVSFDADLTAPPVWTDITTYARSIDFQRGRQFELDQFEAGTCAVVLSTNDGRFSPENTSGPYAAYLTPLRRIRIIAEWDGSTYPLWAGFVETWEPNVAANGKDLITTMRCADAFKALRYVDASGSYPAQLAGQRIRSLLDGVTAYEVVTSSDGTEYSTPVVVSNQDPLGFAQTAAAVEQGFLYCDEQGRIRFDDRNYRTVNETTARIVFGDGTGETPYTDASYSYNDERLYTEVKVKPGDFGSEQTAENAQAIAEYGRRTLSLTLPVQVGENDDTPDEEWCASLANFLLNRYDSPGIRLDELETFPASDPSMWPDVLSAPLGGRLLVRQRPAYLAATGAQNLTSPTKVTGTMVTTGTGGTLERAVYIERISMTIPASASEWRVRYGLSSADTLTYWVLGRSGFSELAETTRLGL